MNWDYEDQLKSFYIKRLSDQKGWKHYANGKRVKGSDRMIPTCFSNYFSLIPLINEVTKWSLLRKWTLSEVYRVRLATGESRIIKWAGNEMAKEALVYQELVHPLQIKAPEIIEFVQLKDSGVMVMEDVGEKNLEQQPHPSHFLEASRELAILRMMSE
ncbi:hypothetical protein ABER23_13185 [Paenibacillus lautus]|uniref:hypothetical protein n=1 Tax=Paenibacillus lautus TaxID=1401 RepID=UPI003D2B04F3